MKPSSEHAGVVATLIGDLVGSRESADRVVLHARLEKALAEVNAVTAPIRPLWITAGDEYQGTFVDVGSAVQASLLIRVRLAPEQDVRHGVGWGATTILDARSGVQDGPGWWAARSAIDAVAKAEATTGSRSLRTAYRLADGQEGPDPGWVNALLVLRDERVTGLSARSMSVLRGLLSGETQRELAETIGISPSAVSQRVRADGLGALVLAHELMADMGGGQ